MNPKWHTADQLARIARDPMRAAFVHQLMRSAERVTLETREGVCLSITPARMPYCVQFYGWTGEVQS